MKKIKEYLKESFDNWRAEKLMQHLTFQKDIDENLLSELSLSKNEFIGKYLDIFNGLTIEQIKKIFDILAVFIQKDSKSFYTISIDLKVTSLINALNWTEIYISHILGFEPSIRPIGQCYYCGRTEDYSYIDHEEKQHDCSFNSVTKFCHVDGCVPVNINKNYIAHPNCCYGKLEIIKHKKNKRFKNPYRKKEENIKEFIELCEYFLQDRLDNAQYTVQYIDRHGNLVKAKHKSEWGKEIISWQEYINNDK